MAAPSRSGSATGATNADSAIVNMSGLASLAPSQSGRGVFPRVGDKCTNGGSGTGQPAEALATDNLINAGTWRGRCETVTKCGGHIAAWFAGNQH